MGLSPLIMDDSSSAIFHVPKAISLGFGIMLATLITLILVPTNLLIADDARLFFKRRAEEIKNAVTAS